METQVGQSSRLSNSPWKQTRCHCKEEINKEVVSLMEAECSCMICEEIFVDATVTQCGHTFCDLCVKKWYCTSPKQDCPMCRQPLAIGTVKRNVEVDSFVTRLHLRLSDKIKRTRNSLLKTRRSNVLKFNAKLPNCQSVSLPATPITSTDEEDFRRIRTQLRTELSSSRDHDAQIPTVTLELDKVDASVQTDDPPSQFDSLNLSCPESHTVSTLEELYQVLQSEPSTRFDPQPSSSLLPTVHGQSQYGEEGNDDEEVLILPTPKKIPKVLDFIDITDDHSDERTKPGPSSVFVSSSVQNRADEPIVLEPVPSTSSSTAANLNSPPYQSSTVDLSALDDNTITPSIQNQQYRTNRGISWYQIPGPGPAGARAGSLAVH
ncbi:tripartite motif-containing protein 5 [Folsomia candida]|uniref:tripartite motif-containing protein 5 n=1 Tax=Folsomia candida TaxID=158441 RepID=UPI000B8F5368|nr:tripartite motif-containing protein 5 [Folsomia candida]XP_021960771.1 tripartite motif-containing protein 5 [Folsomia candida]XP_035713107.1 tripartite motif-containing protein 5 [Folsomia candida]XP_035713108.1 tripartite motif-containing protein 5 [Folsomia candida]